MRSNEQWAVSNELAREKGCVVVKNYKELIVWQKAHQMTLDVYSVTRDFPMKCAAFCKYRVDRQARRSITYCSLVTSSSYERRIFDDSRGRLMDYNVC